MGKAPGGEKAREKTIMDRLLLIGQHIPIWVFILFFGLLFLGYLQTKIREISYMRALTLPSAMTIYSLYGAVSTFGFSIDIIGYWLSGILLAVALNTYFRYPKDAKYNAETKSFKIPGSYIPLILIMGIFFTKFFLGFAKARHLAALNDLGTIALVSALLGFFSGIFLASGLALWRIKNRR